MIEVAPLIVTLGTERYKELLLTPFRYEMLETHLGWNKIKSGTDGRGSGSKYSSGNMVIDVSHTGYEITLTNTTRSYTDPEILSDFFSDMRRLGVTLYWGDWIEKEYEPKDFLPQNKIEGYYIDLLNSIDKGHELTTEKEGDENEEKL